VQRVPATEQQGRIHTSTATVAFADVLVLNKTDLVSPREVDALEARIRSMNAIAKVERAVHAAVSIAGVLDAGGFDLGRALDTKPTFLEPEVPSHSSIRPDSRGISLVEVERLDQACWSGKT
jgi:G3E family GTPase